MEPCSSVEDELPAYHAVLEAQRHIAKIRSEKFDGREGDELTANARTIISALAIFAQTLNSQPTHFLLEFIQNADDNSYAPDAVPSLSISCRPGYCQIDCNEVGFQPSDVDAICNLGQSTKVNRPGSIGEKGIGFKSVFKVAKSVWVCSNSYSFKFDRDAQLGMLAPAWADFPEHVFGSPSAADLTAFSSSVGTGTKFMLQLDDDKQAYAEKSLQRQLHRLHSDSVLLLFLRNLRHIHVSIDDLSGRPQGKFLNTITRQDGCEYGGELIKIRNTWTTNRTRRAGEELTDEYFVVRHIADNMPTDEKRKGITSSEVVLAFPFQRGQPIFHRQKAYAFLPIRESGFRFLAQADFILIANREAIQAPVAWLENIDTPADSPTQGPTHPFIIHEWNWRLLCALADCFVKAVWRFNCPDAHKLRYTWLGFLQDLPVVEEDNPFSLIASHIFDRLREYPVLETQTRNALLVEPAKAVYVPKYLRNAHGHFVLAHVLGRTGDHYLSSGYDSHDPEQVVLRRLGVQIMDFAQFFSLLGEFMSKSILEFIKQPPEFHSLISQILYESPKGTDLSALALITIRDGRWVRQLDGQCYFAASDTNVLHKLPEGIDDLLIVDAAASQDPFRRQLLVRLGVKDLSKAEVCRLISACHEHGYAPATNVDVLIEHAAYLFEASRATISFKKPERFWVLDVDGQPRLAGTMYLDTADMSIGRLLPRPICKSKLLHPAYSLHYPSGKNKEKWIKWLESNLNVALVMRIAQSGNSFTEEFLHAMDMPTESLMEIMVASWLKYSTTFSSTIKNMLGAIQVTCENGQKVRLSQTILPTKGLKSFAIDGLPFLPIRGADAQKWKFLQELGVVVGPELGFYLKCLELLQGTPIPREKAVAVYERIFGCMMENPKRVIDYFALPNAAIYIPHAQRWVPKSECVWGSVAGATGAYELSAIYPMLQSFFIHHLHVSTASIDKVIAELMAMPTSGEDNLSKRKQLIFTMSEFLRKRPQDHTKLQRSLTDKPVMPIMAKCGLEAADVRSLNKATWLFADRHHYFEAFNNLLLVSFADFSVEQYPRLEPLNAAIRNAWGADVDHCLSRSVAESNEQGRQTVRNVAATKLLRSKVKYLRSITRASLGNKGSEMARKLEMLHNLNVYSAPHMVISPSLLRGQLGRPVEGRPIPAKVYLKECCTESKKELQVYIRHHTSDRLPVSELSNQICLFAGVRQEKLHTLVKDVLIEEDARDIDDLLSKANIDGYDDYGYQAEPVQPMLDARNARATGEACEGASEDARQLTVAVEEPKEVDSCLKVTTAPSKIANDTPQALCNISNQGAILTAKDLNQLVSDCRRTTEAEPAAPKPVKHVYQGFSTSSIERVPLPSKAGAVLSHQISRRKANGRWDSIVFDQQPIARTGRGPPFALAHVREMGLKPAEKEAREERIGIQGELKVFRTLQNILGEDLDQSCWTSELRELAGDEFTPWTPVDVEAVYCDFTVQDIQGRLTAWLVREGFQCPNTHRDLTYHIEVKSTVGTWDEPFHMSALQMKKCKEVSVTADQWSGQDIFVIFRLYGLGQSGGLMIYIDPWTKINEGHLERQPDGWLVRDRA